MLEIKDQSQDNNNNNYKTIIDNLHHIPVLDYSECTFTTLYQVNSYLEKNHPILVRLGKSALWYCLICKCVERNDRFDAIFHSQIRHANIE